jgi:superoxide dismutase, Fe-Mn family
MTFAMKPLSCDPQRLRGLSERLILSHYENNYGGAVKRLNAITQRLSELDFTQAPVFVVNGLKREQLIAMNSMILHELYFDGLGGESEPDVPLLDAFARDFGSFERWRSEFTATGKALAGGSGWVLLTYSPRDDRLMNQWASDHSDPCRRAPDPGARYVRARISYRLRRESCCLCGQFHASHPVGKCK